MTNLFTNLLQWPVIVFLWQEVNVSWRDDSHQLAAHFTSFGDRDAGEAVPYLSLEHVANRVPRAHHHWICDKALLKFLPWSHSTGWWLDTSSVSVLRDSRASKSLSFTLTFRTSFAWNSGVQLWWMMPIPPMSWHMNQKKKKKKVKSHITSWLSSILKWPWLCLTQWEPLGTSHHSNLIMNRWD